MGIHTIPVGDCGDTTKTAAELDTLLADRLTPAWLAAWTDRDASRRHRARRVHDRDASRRHRDASRRVHDRGASRPHREASRRVRGRDASRPHRDGACRLRGRHTDSAEGELVAAAAVEAEGPAAASAEGPAAAAEAEANADSAEDPAAAVEASTFGVTSSGLSSLLRSLPKEVLHLGCSFNSASYSSKGIATSMIMDMSTLVVHSRESSS